MQTAWQQATFDLKTYLDNATEAAASAPPDSVVVAADDGDVLRRLTSELESAEGISVSTPVTAIMVVSAFVFLTVFSVIAYVMRVRYRHHVTTWQHVGEEGIQLQPFLRSA